MSSEFTDRLSQAFDGASMADIARKIGVPHATIRNYFGGRLPSPEVLIKIAAETNVSLNWLLLGNGQMYMSGAEPIDLNKILDRRIEEILERKLAGIAETPIQNLSVVDAKSAFDVEAAIVRLGDPHKVMSEWFGHEGRSYPQDFGLAFFQGWDSFTKQERTEAILDAKKVLDRTLKKRS